MSITGDLDGPQTDLPDGLIYNYLEPVKKAISDDVKL